MTNDARTAGITAKIAVEKARREIPFGTMQPATVYKSSVDDQSFGHATALVHIDGNPPGQLNEVDVTDKGVYRPGDRVMVEYVEPQGAIIRGHMDCEERIELLPFSSATELSTGDVSGPGRVETDAVLIRVLLDFRVESAAQTWWRLTQGVGGTVLWEDVVSISTTYDSGPLSAEVLFDDGPMYAMCVDNGSGGWEAVTLTAVLSAGCSSVTVEGGGGGGE